MIARRKVAVVMRTNMGCYRELLLGIGRFVNAKATWEIQYLTPLDNLNVLLKERHPEGLLLGAANEHAALSSLSDLVPAIVGVCASPADLGVPMQGAVDVDNRQIGHVAANYFLQKGYKNFAYVGHVGDDEIGGRGFGFAETLAQSGFRPATLLQRWEGIAMGRGWTKPYPNPEITPFIQSQPKPLAVLVFNDARGRELIEACRIAGVNVPEDVAVLGVDNDLLDCDLSNPALSSVQLPWQHLGYLAASLLDQLLDGESIQSQTLAAPVGVVERQSTNIVAISDPDVSLALQYIRENAHRPYSIEDLLRGVPLGRRTLEKRFRMLLGRSLLEEIRRVRFDRARQLLSQTDLPVDTVAERSGFAKAKWFSRAFQQAFSESPHTYRKRLQQPAQHA